METWEELQLIEKQLNQALQTLRANGIAVAEAEKEYRIAKASRTLEYKQQGYPITIIPDLVKGSEDIAELCLKRDCAEAVYKANQQAIVVKQQEYKMYQIYFEKEYQLAK